LESLEALAGPGGRDFLHNLIEVYLSDTESRLAAMREASGNGDAAKLARTAHSIMGSSLSMGAEALAALMRESVRDGRNGILPGSDRLRAGEAEFMRVKTALLSFLA
jgi:hypothetical protein